ncbi:hypothetical protein HYH03_013363 [Edaphochlamys debaryana]|uniref:WW domain-containing protein n=1 Tax=Edaphochlamys debaryana TaxID=47281 RepID=A0A835XYM5_9CHLO|nr:hypothetical protein HYH03_013363 [Edaphochlamys debaryana]|eukprot:KAG2488059.1 hypothetical protein HYH03_013363 [Edaphochlamys debaryana]
MMSRRTLALIGVLLLSGVLLASAAPKEGSKKGSKKGFVSTFELDGARWAIHKNDEGRAFFYNEATGSTSWTDPRVEPLSSSDRMLVMAMFAAPFVLMIAGAVVYVLWVRYHHPELLKPKKKVKGRKNWEKALDPPGNRKDRARSASPPVEDIKAVKAQ